MASEISVITSSSSFSDLWKNQLPSLSTPYNPFAKYFDRLPSASPSSPLTDATIALAIEATKARHIAAWQDNENVHWVQAVEIATGKVIGGACWTVNEKGYDVQHLERVKAFKADWYEEGERREFVGRLIRGIRTTVVDRMQGRPHIGNEAHHLVVGVYIMS
jgi:hypothetical protein